MSWSHKDPSGTLNKARWLLDKSKRDRRELYKLYDRHYNDIASGLISKKCSQSNCYVKYCSSWESAFIIAQYCLLHNIDNPSDVFNSVNFDFERGTTLVQGDRQWEPALKKYFNTIVSSALEKNGSSLLFDPSLSTLFNLYEVLVKSGDIEPSSYLKGAKNGRA